MSSYLDGLASGGAASYTVTAASFVQPTVGATVTIQVASSAWAAVLLAVFIANGGNYQITAISDATHLTIKNLGGSSNAAPDATVPVNQRVTAAGTAGQTGPTGPQGKGVFAVRAIQTAALTSWVYDKNAGTLTAPANGALPSPWPAFDNITTPAVSDDGFEVNTLGAANAQNGVYTIAAVGSGGSKAALQRRVDLNTNALFVGGASYSVRDGALNKGTYRQLLTQGAIDLFAVTPTPLTFGEVRERDLKEIDLSKEPYNVRGASTQAGATVDYGPAIKRAMRTLVMSGQRGRVRAPMGWITAVETIHVPKQVDFVGAGRGKTMILQASGRTGGWQCHLGTLDPWTIASPYVDATSVGSSYAAPIKMWGVTSYQDVIINLTDVGWYYTKIGLKGWSQYDTRINLRAKDLAVGTHVYSTRGRCSKGMPLDVCDRISIQPDGAVSANIRAWHDTKVKKTAGAGATVLTLSGTPLPEGTMLRVEITTAGPRGTFRFRVSECSGGSWGWAGGKVDPATGLTPGILSAATNTLDGHLAGIVLNWSNASAAVDDRWQNYEVLSVYTAPGKIVVDTIQQIALTFDGTTANLRVSTVGGAYDTPTGSQTANTTLTGAYVQQQVYEDTVMGNGCNSLILESVTDENAAGIHFGAILSQDAIASFAGTVPAAIVSAIGGASTYYMFQPNTQQCTYAESGDSSTPIVGFTTNGSILGEIINGRNVSGQQSADYDNAIREMSFISATGNAGCGILADGIVTQCIIDQVECSGHAKGFIWKGSGYYNTFSDLIMNGRRMSMGVVNGESPIRGTITLLGFGINYAEVFGGGKCVGDLWFQPGASVYAGIVVLEPQGSKTIDITLDGEGSDGYRLAATVLGIGADRVLQLDGVCASNSRQPVLLDNGGSSVGQVILNCEISYTDSSANCIATTLGVPVCKTLRGGPNFSAPDSLPRTDRANFWIPSGGKPVSIALNAAAITSATVLTSAAEINCYTIAAGQVAALDALRLAGGAEGTEFRIVMRAQSQDLLIKDDTSGSIIDTLTAGMSGTFVYRTNGKTYALGA